ncbi:MAG: hypothetical protein HQK99_17040 [Nitrospirae bacterium]|nr:hypothetical protein [Nitrospirota bacterium]
MNENDYILTIRPEFTRRYRECYTERIDRLSQEGLFLILEILVNAFDVDGGIIAYDKPVNDKFIIVKKYFRQENDGNHFISKHIRKTSQIESALAKKIVKKVSGVKIRVQENIVEENENSTNAPGMAHMFYFTLDNNDGFLLLLNRTYVKNSFLPDECLIAQSAVTYCVSSLSRMVLNCVKSIDSDSIQTRCSTSEILLQIHKEYDDNYYDNYDKYLFTNIDSKLNIFIRQNTNKTHKIEIDLKIGDDILEIEKIIKGNYSDTKPLLNAALLMLYSYLEYLYKKDKVGFGDDLKKLINHLKSQVSTTSEDDILGATVDIILGCCTEVAINNQITESPDMNSYYKSNQEIIESCRAIFFLFKSRSIEYDYIFTKDISKELKDPITRKEFQDKLKDVLSKYLKTWGNNNKTKVTSNWLLCWFGIKLLDSNALNDYLNKNIYPPEMTRLFLRRFTSYFLFLFHCIRNYGNPSRTHYTDDIHSEVTLSHIYMIVEYAHIDCKIDRTINLFGMLHEMLSMEAAHYTVSGSGYREHLNHSINCCLFGFMLLHTKNKDTSFFGKNKYPFVDMLEKKSLDNNFGRWFFTSLLHDIGYSLNLSRSPFKLIEENYKSGYIKTYLQSIKGSTENAERILCENIDDDLKNNDIKLKYDRIKINHSVIITNKHISM